jgi:g-D-glutamyl-meso-diaminopimelate peptidase
MEIIVRPKEITYHERQILINRICEKYEFIKRFSIGKSCLGKDITALKIGVSDSYCLITAGMHGSERITSNIILMFLEALCKSFKMDGTLSGVKIRKGMLGRGVIIVPCVNPDGCDISLLGETACASNAEKLKRLCRGNFKKWNANYRGVDLNHNFNADWENLREKEKLMGIVGPAPTRFGGYKPHSEPETLALVNLCKRVNIRHTLALHSQGEVIYWNFGDKIIPKAKKMAEIMAASSGYALDVPVNIATGGGFKDWFIKEFNRPGFTAEVGKGENPLPPSEATKIYKRIEEMLVLYCIM